jgi:serine/threonine-protein kinase
VSEWAVPGYTALRPLGSGGFGTVLLARHDATGTEVAIKYLHGEMTADPDVGEMFRAEAMALGSLDDPHVVRLYEYVESPQGAAIVMELVDGVSLRDILSRQGKTTPEAALVVLLGSLLGLAAAHAHGVVHRDYKPANVLVNAYGASKLTDFGIAVRAGASALPAGTLAYAPPEQLDGAPASPAGDVYAATATFYECLAGRPPFTGETTEALMRQHHTAPVPMEPVPEPLRTLVAAGLAKDPGRRPASAADLAIALRSVAAQAYGEGWEGRGRTHLGEAAILLAALWPSAGGPALQGSTAEHVRLSHEAGGARNAGEQARLHRWHLRHILHLKHLRHLARLRAALPVAAAAAVLAAGATVAATSHASPPSQSGPAAAAAPFRVPLASIAMTTASGLPPVTGDVYVRYHDGSDSSARITGEIKNAVSGEVIRLYAQQFPYASAPVPGGTVAVTPQGSSGTYAFQVTPVLATRYQVRLFASSTATTPLATSAITTIYVTVTKLINPYPSCGRVPACHLTFTLTSYVPPAALGSEISKPWYTYLGLSASGSPAWAQLGAGSPVVTKPQVIAANEFNVTVSLTFSTVSVSHIHWRTCSKDTEATDGIGLPGSHGCGSARIPASAPYIG